MFEGLPGHAKRWSAGALAVLALLGCEERNRLTFPNPSTGAGPSSAIDQPAQDTTVDAGPGFIITGVSVDEDGIDTVYFETEGGVTSFAPFIPDGSPDSVRFGLPITTNGLAGEVITFRVFGTDVLGNRGDTASRQITVE